jgi:Zn finger protein HypA/HybF involved in hydrogenase expression
MYSQTQTQLKELWKNSPANKGTMLNPRKQQTNQPCKTCEDTDTGLPCGQVLTNDVGSSGKEQFFLADCPTCKGQKFIYTD